MATLAENAAAVKAAQVAIDAAIVAKGGTTAGGLTNAAAAIAALPSGGDDFFGYVSDGLVFGVDAQHELSSDWWTDQKSKRRLDVSEQLPTPGHYLLSNADGRCACFNVDADFVAACGERFCIEAEMDFSGFELTDFQTYILGYCSFGLTTWGSKTNHYDMIGHTTFTVPNDDLRLYRISVDVPGNKTVFEINDFSREIETAGAITSSGHHNLSVFGIGRGASLSAADVAELVGVKCRAMRVYGKILTAEEKQKNYNNFLAKEW